MGMGKAGWGGRYGKCGIEAAAALPFHRLRVVLDAALPALITASQVYPRLLCVCGGVHARARDARACTRDPIS